MATTAQGYPIRNFKAEIPVFTPWDNVVSYNFTRPAMKSTLLACPPVSFKDRVHPFFVLRAVAHNAIFRINATLPIPVVFAGVSGADSFAPLRAMDIVRLSFIPRLVSFCEAIGIAKAFAFSGFRNSLLRFFCVVALKALGFIRSSVRPVLESFFIIGFLNGSLDFFNRFWGVFPTGLSLCGHSKSPMKNGANSAKVFRSAINYISRLFSRSQADNAEPAGKIAQGFPGVCDGQG
jgi:hypothetical protein